MRLLSGDVEADVRVVAWPPQDGRRLFDFTALSAVPAANAVEVDDVRYELSEPVNLGVGDTLRVTFI